MTPSPVNTGLETALAEAMKAFPQSENTLVNKIHQYHRHKVAETYRKARHEYFGLVPVHELTLEGMKAHCLEKARGYIRRHAKYEQPKGDDAA